MKLADLFLSVGAEDSRLDGDLKKSENRTLSWVKGLATATAAAVGAAVIATGAAVVDGLQSYTDFEKRISEVFTLLPDMSQAAMDKMSTDARNWGAELGVLTDKSIPALYQSISAGVPPENVFDFLTTANKAAVGGVTELETAVDGISSVVNAYGQDVIKATQASDLMFTAVKLGKTDFTQLSQSLFNVIPTAASLGIEFGDVTAALAAMTAQGTPTSVATTQLRQLFVELSKEGSKVADTFQKVSGKSFKDFIAEGNNTADALAVLEKHAKKSDKSISDLFGSVEAGNAALALTGSGTDVFLRNLDEMEKSAGATEKAFQTMEKTSARGIERLKAKFENEKLRFAEKLEPALSGGIRLLENFSNNPAVTAFADKLLANIEKVGQSVGMLADGDFAGAIGNLFGSDVATNAMDFFGKVDNFFTNSILPGSLLLKEAGKAFLGLFGPDILASLNSMRESAGALFSGLTERAGPFIDGALTKFSTWIIENGPLISAFFSWIADGASNLVPVVLLAVDIIMPLLGGLVDIVLKLATLIMQVATGDWAGAWQSIQSIASIAAAAIGESLTVFLNGIAGLFGTSLAEIGSIWSENWNLFVEILVKLKDIAGEKIKDIIARIKELFNVDWGEVGMNIIAGIAAGISGGVGSIISAARDAAKAALSAAKEALGIQSPSKEAEKQVGSPLAEGIGVGVRKQEGALRNSLSDMLKNAMQGLGLDAMPVGLQPAPGLSAIGGNTTVNIYNNSPLQIFDEYSLENMLTPVVDRIVSKKR